ncbi:hypothetical protein AVEN_219769-1 [Araneus ventricosus]|uniref:Reverse transcriptase domain-containing protein n=1 Tax=Araneus ventricosus TaxID=182803 RepID=A0A4Y2SXV0_ARAVE|nr:hypothetical protein AVEN_219769-1 [Araneus ventricosus]
MWYSGIKWVQNNIRSASVIKYLGILINDKLNFAAHLSAIKNKSLILHQGLKKVAGTSWGYSENISRQLYPNGGGKGHSLCLNSMGPQHHCQATETPVFYPKKVFTQHHSGHHNPNGGTPSHRRSNASSH